MFCKLRPFLVIKPSTERDRETCLCKIHDNLRLKLNTAYAEYMYETKDLDKLCSKNCDEKNMSCIYRECTLCKGKLLPCSNNDEGKQVVWKKWKTKRFEKHGNETDKTTKIVGWLKKLRKEARQHCMLKSRKGSEIPTRKPDCN